MTAQQRCNFAARNKKVTIMNTKYTIKNFRVFDEKGVTVDIKPITILTGCNNSGKSSIVKSMVLLDTYVRSIISDYKSFNRFKFRDHKLDFTKESTQSLGNFKQVLNRKAKNNVITFEYTVHSILLGEDVRVSASFLAEEKDILNEGYIKEFRICKLNGDVIYLSSRDIPCESDGNLIVENFYRFVRGQYLVDQYRKYEAKHRNIYQGQTEEEYKASMKDLSYEASEQWMSQQEKDVDELGLSKVKIDKLESDFVGVYGKDALIDVINWSNRYGYNYGDVLGIDDQEGKKTIMDIIGNVEVVDQSYNKHSFFWCPLLDEIGFLSSEEFRDGLLKAMTGYNLRKEVSLALDRIVSDFESSNCSTFEEYYKIKEYNYLKKSLPAKDRHMNPPFLVGDFSRYRFDDAPVYGYLNEIHLHLDDDISSLTGVVDFARLYNVIMNLNAIREDSDHSDYYRIKDNWGDVGPYKEFEHCLYSMFNEYWTAVLRESILSLPNEMAYVPTSLVNVKRLYALDYKDDFTYLLKQYLEEKRQFPGGSSWEKAPFVPGMFINKWIKELKIGDSVSFEADSEGLGVYLRLHNSPDDKKGSLLAEQGYGITQLFVILLRIEIAIMKSKREVINKDPYDMGCPSHYWKEDSEVAISLSESTIAIEEPEVHLHPSFQSLLAEMFYDAYTNYNVQFVIETHSEYLIRKLQVMVADKENSLMSDEISLNYIEKEDFGSSNRKINIQEDGRLNEPFGPGFFDEADSLAMEILKYKARRR